MKETIIFTSTAQQLFSLVRASLWQLPVDLKPFKDATAKCDSTDNLSLRKAVDWDAIGKMASQQTVVILMINAALSLPSEFIPSKEWILKAYSLMERNRRTHLLLDNCVAEAIRFLKEVNIKATLLKGQAYARSYPHPVLRQCGDIDLYLGEENFNKAYKYSILFGWNSEEVFTQKAKHYGCKLKGVRIELHRLAAILSSSGPNRKFQKWSSEEINSSKRTLLINEEEPPVPSPIFDVVYVFLHLYHHFINGGIGLRHVCDWVMLLHKHSKEIDKYELIKLLTDFQLLRAWEYFTPIAVNYLGLPENECLLYTLRYSKKSDRILSLILEEGNFGKYKTKQSSKAQGFWSRKIHTFLELNRTMVPRLSIEPRRVVNNYCRTLGYGIRGALIHLLRL